MIRIKGYKKLQHIRGDKFEKINRMNRGQGCKKVLGKIMKHICKITIKSRGYILACMVLNSEVAVVPNRGWCSCPPVHLPRRGMRARREAE